MAGNDESKITLKMGALIALLAILFGYFFITGTVLGNRMTKVETLVEIQIPTLTKSVDTLAIEVKGLRGCCYNEGGFKRDNVAAGGTGNKEVTK
jgi:hypothetical protein